MASGHFAVSGGWLALSVWVESGLRVERSPWQSGDVLRARLARLGMLATVVACSAEFGSREAVDWGDLRLPSGLALDPSGRWLWVTGGNWDARDEAAQLAVLDLQAIEQSLESGPGLDSKCSEAWTAQSPTICPVSEFILPSLGVALPDGAGNLELDHPRGPNGPLRLLTVSRVDSALTWIDVHRQADGDLAIDCGRDEDRRCDELHTLSGLEPEPSRIQVDSSGFRYAYVPHLLGGRMTLIDLDGPVGPEIVDEREEFFAEHPFGGSEPAAGGFDVLQVGCDLSQGSVPRGSQACTRPVSVVSHRFWNGFRAFGVVEAGGPRLQAISDRKIAWSGHEGATEQPIMADLLIEEGVEEPRILAVQTTPPALLRIDASVEASGFLSLRVLDSIPLCEDPNLLALYRAEQGSQASRRLALVTCPAANELAVIDLSSFRVLRFVGLGAGANEVLIDPARNWAYVANTREHTISILELDAGAPTFLREIAIIAGAHAPVERGGAARAQLR